MIELLCRYLLIQQAARALELMSGPRAGRPVVYHDAVAAHRRDLRVRGAYRGEWVRTPAVYGPSVALGIAPGVIAAAAQELDHAAH
jgi:hypothetical protein